MLTFSLSFLLFLAVSLFILKRVLSLRLEGFVADCELSRASHDIISKEYQALKKINSTLSGYAQNLLEFYELTKELTKYLSLDEVFMVFRERLRKNIAIEDCQFLLPNADSSALSGYELFPVTIDKTLLGNLAVKGLRAQDKNTFYILFNQLFLVLKRVRLYASIEELAITDGLTGLFRRRYLQEKLEEEIDRCNKMSLKFVFLMLDLDHFKNYNDRYGHLVGDGLLSSVAGILKDNLRQVDIVARYGGEEFAIILPNTDREEAKFISSRLRQSIEQAHIEAYGENLQITISIGASIFPSDAKESQELIDKADQAMYRAKQSGRNQVRFCHENNHRRFS